VTLLKKYSKYLNFNRLITKSRRTKNLQISSVMIL